MEAETSNGQRGSVPSLIRAQKRWGGLEPIDHNLSDYLGLRNGIKGLASSRGDDQVSGRRHSRDINERQFTPLVFKSLSVVQVQFALSLPVLVQEHLQSDCVVDARQQSVAVIVLQDWQDRAASNKDTLLEVSQGPVVSPLAGRSLCGTSLVVEPRSASRQVEIDHLLVLGTLKRGGLSHFGRKQDRITEHELSVNVVSFRVVGEFIPHCSHERLGRASSLLEAGVDVVD